jgi:hypothetical protein
MRVRAKMKVEEGECLRVLSAKPEESEAAYTQRSFSAAGP